ncbi:hypothetical protein V2J09_008512 [Rumex salicifolius]
MSSVDFEASSLLCVEDNAGIFDEVESGGVDLDHNQIDDTWDPRIRNQSPIFPDSSSSNGGQRFLSSGLSLPVLGVECLDAIFKREVELLPSGDYLRRLKTGDVDLVARNEAVDWIAKVQSHYNFGPLCENLSVNYLDRFLSAHELPKGKAWMMQLLAVACLYLAAKMEETKVPLAVDLQTESRFVFEAKTIQRMELLVLSTLKWRMQSVTPFSFIEFFLTKLCTDQQITPMCLFPQASQLIISTTKGIEFMEFRPSEVAAAIAILVVKESNTTYDIEKAISLLIVHVEKGRLAECIKKVQDFASIGGGISMAVKNNGVVPHSPIGVLDVSTCLSYDTPNNTPIGQRANSTQESPVSHSKRRKLNF